MPSNQDVLLSLLNAVLKLPSGRELTTVNLLDQEQDSAYLLDRMARCHLGDVSGSHNSSQWALKQAHNDNEISLFGAMIAIILNTYNEKGGSKRLATYRQRRG